METNFDYKSGFFVNKLQFVSIYKSIYCVDGKEYKQDVSCRDACVKMDEWKNSQGQNLKKEMIRGYLGIIPTEHKIREKER